MPLGMQIIGNSYDTSAVLKVGYAFSKGGIKLYQGSEIPKLKNTIE